MGGIYEFTVEMGTDAMVYVPSFIDWFRNSKDEGGFTNAQTTW
jgi:hypothetical protein